MVCVPGRLALVLVLVAVAAACHAPPKTMGYGPPVLRLKGEASVDVGARMVRFRLDPEACMRRRTIIAGGMNVEQVREPCPPQFSSLWNGLVVLTPWGSQLKPASVQVSEVTFAVDWQKSGVDALAQDDPELLKKPWEFVLTGNARADRTRWSWQPGDEDRRAMLTVIGEATDTQLIVETAEAEPAVEVSDLHLIGELRNASESEIVLSVSNRGKGPAYRLWVVTRSDVAALHGVRFSFGKLDPGQTKTRRARVKIPRDNEDTDAVVVLNFNEAHRYVPAPLTTRHKIQPATFRAVLALECQLDGHASAPARVDAGEPLHVTCAVKNSGSPAQDVRLQARISGGSESFTARPFELGTDKATKVTFVVDVPRNASTDAQLILKIVVKDMPSSATAEQELPLVIARPQLCPGGMLSRDQYNKKRAELVRKLEAGLIKKQEFERYEAELVNCLE